MNKINLHYKVEGKGKPLVFIHGLSDNLLYWEFLAAKLKNDYQIIMVDLRGHGDSELGSDEITIDLYVNDLINLLDELHVDKVNLIGFSLGGAVALDFVLKYPKKVDSLVLMSSFAKTDEYLTDIFNQFKSSLNNGFEDFFDLIVPMVFCPDYIEYNKNEFEILKQALIPIANVDAFIKAIDACFSFDVENELSLINIPTLILAGQCDELTLADTQKRISEQINDSKLIVFENTKHNLLVEKNNPEIVSILKNFYENK